MRATSTSQIFDTAVPSTPGKVALRAKAASFRRVVATPRVSAASSCSRIARSLYPIRERSIRP